MKYIFIFCVLLLITSSHEIFAESPENIPNWIKNTAGWWAEDAISETEFINTIEFLIMQNIIQITSTTQSQSPENIPNWIKNTAGLWAEDAISETEFINTIEFLVNVGVINISSSIGETCDESVDKNGDRIPDIFDEIPSADSYPDAKVEEDFVNAILSFGIEINGENFSNCTFPKNISHISFTGQDLTNADFSNSKLFNVFFKNVDLSGANFSNTKFTGVSFTDSTLTDVNFKNTDFEKETWEEPWIIFTTHTTTDDGQTLSSWTCYYVPCFYYQVSEPISISGSNFSFTVPKLPVSLEIIDVINDGTEFRTMWRHINSFLSSEIRNSNFNDSNLAYTVFVKSSIQNTDFSNTDVSNVILRNTHLYNVKLNDMVNYEDERINELKIVEENHSTIPINLHTEKFSNPKNINIDIKFVGALDEIPINWSMGMVIDKEKLYIADTDNHRVSVYDLNTLQQLYTFSSPIQHYCNGVNAWSAETTEECPPRIRNLPTSVTIFDQQILASYGYQDEIQFFDINGNFINRFGQSGDQVGEFNGPFRITTHQDELYVVDSGNHRIQVFNSNLEFSRQFDTNIGDFNNSKPYDIDIHSDRIFVADSSRSTILVFDLSGKYLTELLINPDLPSKHITSVHASDDLLFVTDKENNMITILDLDGNVIMNFGKIGDYYGEFRSPYYMTTDGGRIFVSDVYNHRIQIFDIERLS